MNQTLDPDGGRLVLVESIAKEDSEASHAGRYDKVDFDRREDAGLVRIEKKFVNERPNTNVAVTPEGRLRGSQPLKPSQVASIGRGKPT